jgi:hypothetical protein
VRFLKDVWHLPLAQLSKDFHIHLLVSKPDTPNDLVSEEGHADCKVANNTKTDEEAVEHY